MSILDKEEVVAPTIEAAVAEAIKPATSVNHGAECTRNTRGEAACIVKDCENCN